jgi:hypothetical protein
MSAASGAKRRLTMRLGRSALPSEFCEKPKPVSYTPPPWQHPPMTHARSSTGS